MSTPSLSNSPAPLNKALHDQASILRERKLDDTALQIAQKKMQFENAMAKGREVKGQLGAQHQHDMVLLSKKAGVLQGQTGLTNGQIPQWRVPPALQYPAHTAITNSTHTLTDTSENTLPFKAAIGALISRLSHAEDDKKSTAISSPVSLSPLLPLAHMVKPSAAVFESKASILVDKVNVIQSMVASITPHVSKLIDSQSLTLRVHLEHSAPLEIQLSRQGNELSVNIKTNSPDVLNQLVQTRQDLQYSLENKLPNTMVKIHMDLAEQSDRKSKGEYIAADEDDV